MPTSIRLGLVVMAMAIAIDLAAHVVEPSVVGHTGAGHVHTPVQVSAHVHNVTFTGATSLVMKPGDHLTRTFPAAGTFTYRCTLNPADMQGSVIVTGG